MTTKSSNKLILTRLALPIATMLLMLTSCKNTDNSTDKSSDDGCIQITIIDDSSRIIDSLLHENRKLTDSLSVANERLDSCENARSKRCPQTKPVQKKPTQKKPVQKKPAQQTPVQTAPVQKPVATTPSNEIKIGTNNSGNNTVVIGNENEINNVVINGCTEVVLDTLNQVKTTRRIMSGYAKTTYTYTK